MARALSLLPAFDRRSPSASTAAGSEVTATRQTLSAIGWRCSPTRAQAIPARSRGSLGWKGITWR